MTILTTIPTAMSFHHNRKLLNTMTQLVNWWRGVIIVLFSSYMETGKSNQASNLHWGDQLEFAMNLRARYLPLGILVTADWERLQLQKNTHITGENFECFTRTTCWAFLSRIEKVDKEKTCTQDWKLENKIQDFTCCSQVPIQQKKNYTLSHSIAENKNLP